MAGADRPHGLDEAVLMRFADDIIAGVEPGAAYRAATRQSVSQQEATRCAIALLDRDDVAGFIRQRDRAKTARGTLRGAEDVPDFRDTEDDLRQAYLWLAQKSAKQNNLRDCRAALDSVAKMRGYFTENRKIEHSGTVNYRNLPAEDLQSKFSKLVGGRGRR